jgi:hypothetical protein
LGQKALNLSSTVSGVAENILTVYMDLTNATQPPLIDRFTEKDASLKCNNWEKHTDGSSLQHNVQYWYWITYSGRYSGKERCYFAFPTQ